MIGYSVYFLRKTVRENPNGWMMRIIAENHLLDHSESINVFNLTTKSAPLTFFFVGRSRPELIFPFAVEAPLETGNRHHASSIIRPSSNTNMTPYE